MNTQKKQELICQKKDCRYNHNAHCVQDIIFISGFGKCNSFKEGRQEQHNPLTVLSTQLRQGFITQTQFDEGWKRCQNQTNGGMK